MVYADGMRYPDGGGLTAVGRARREAVRLEAAGLFAQGVSPVEVAERLRVSAKSAYAWRQDWKRGGTAVADGRLWPHEPGATSVAPALPDAVDC